MKAAEEGQGQMMSQAHFFPKTVTLHSSITMLRAGPGSAG